MAGKVYSYIRFSDAKQAAGFSTDRQQAYAERWASENGLALDTDLSMRDEGLSAYHQRHVKTGALGVFLAAIESGAVEHGSVLVVEGLDRLSRAEPIQAQAQLASIVNAGITVVTASDNKVYSRERLKANPMDLVYSLLVMIRAHEESDTKSKRVRDAIRRQCQGWISGSYRGLVRYGKTPSWLQVVDGHWAPIPERVAALQSAVAMYLRGLGAGAIAKKLHEQGMPFSDAMPSSGHLLRLLPHPALVGDKHVELDGETFVLENYYPPVIDRPTQAEVLRVSELRGRRRVKGEIPSLLTGLGITVCGYCGSPMKSQNMTNTRRQDGTILDCNRRLNCVTVNHGQRCPVAGSCSVVPIEKALMSFCSDIVNLQSLFSGDRAAGPKAALAEVNSKLKVAETRLERLMEALLDDADAPPASFMKRARELEAERDKLTEDQKAAERALAEVLRADTTGADSRWQSLREGVHALDKEARLQARQLVADTFERILVFHKGTVPNECAKGMIEVMLMAKGGASRMLRIDAQGGWAIGEDLELAH
jgi:DNA invertase Pin-like site-specific DNA recombinase